MKLALNMGDSGGGTLSIGNYGDEKYNPGFGFPIAGESTLQSPTIRFYNSKSGLAQHDALGGIIFGAAHTNWGAMITANAASPHGIVGSGDQENHATRLSFWTAGQIGDAYAGSSEQSYPVLVLHANTGEIQISPGKHDSNPPYNHGSTSAPSHANTLLNIWAANGAMTSHTGSGLGLADGDNANLATFNSYAGVYNTSHNHHVMTMLHHGRFGDAVDADFLQWNTVRTQLTHHVGGTPVSTLSLGPIYKTVSNPATHSTYEAGARPLTQYGYAGNNDLFAIRSGRVPGYGTDRPATQWNSEMLRVTNNGNVNAHGSFYGNNTVLAAARILPYGSIQGPGAVVDSDDFSGHTHDVEWSHGIASVSDPDNRGTYYLEFDVALPSNSYTVTAQCSYNMKGRGSQNDPVSTFTYAEMTQGDTQQQNRPAVACVLSANQTGVLVQTRASFGADVDYERLDENFIDITVVGRTPWTQIR